MRPGAAAGPATEASIGVIKVALLRPTVPGDTVPIGAIAAVPVSVEGSWAVMISGE
jgi:hypothetical protein